MLDLATIVQQFTALRHEVNLQTRSSRTLLEQNTQALEMLQLAQDTIQQQQASLDEVAEQERNESLRPLLKVLIDAHDALSLARRGVQRLLEKNAAPPAAPAVPPLPAVTISLPFWASWLGLDAAVERQLRPLRAWRAKLPPPPAEPPESAGDRFAQILGGLLAGYDMSLQRIERALQQQDLEIIACAGLPFDPETMEVVEVVRQEGAEATTVLEVVRNGYRWHDRLFRFAQVRVQTPSAG